MRNCSDDCERYHCPKCGEHTLGWLDTFEMCQLCELKFEAANNHVAADDLNHHWPGDGSGEDDLADYNANEADDYRDE